MSKKTELLSQFVTCGNLIEKKRAHFEKIEVHEDLLLSGLTSEEQETLSQLLTKMQDFWRAAHQARQQQS